MTHHLHLTNVTLWWDVSHTLPTGTVHSLFGLGCCTNVCRSAAGDVSHVLNVNAKATLTRVWDSYTLPLVWLIQHLYKVPETWLSHSHAIYFNKTPWCFYVIFVEWHSRHYLLFNDTNSWSTKRKHANIVKKSIRNVNLTITVALRLVNSVVWSCNTIR